MKMPDPGLYRTTEPYPGHEEDIPANVLVFVGPPKEGGLPFVVRPRSNRNNRWFWGEPTQALRALNWAGKLVRLPAEGFYTLPEDIVIEGGGRWLKMRSCSSATTRRAKGSSSSPSSMRTRSATC